MSHALEEGVIEPKSAKFLEALIDTHLEWFTNPQHNAWKRLIGANFFLSYLKNSRNDSDSSTLMLLVSQLDEIMNIDYSGLEGTPADKRNFLKLCSELSLILLEKLRNHEESEEKDEAE